MKNIIKSLLIVVAVAAVASVATWAYFTDQAKVDNNTFASGKLDFTLGGDLTESHSLDLTGMEPGVWYGPYSMNVYNQLSTMPIKYKISDNFVSQTVGGYYQKINAKLEHGSCVGSGISPIHYSWAGKLEDLGFESPTNAISASLGINITHCFQVSFQLDPSTGNAFQNASAVADIVVDGTQTTNSGWTE